MFPALSAFGLNVLKDSLHVIQGDVQSQNPDYAYFIHDYYHMEGLRTATWIVEGVERYHRTMASWVNGIIEAGLFIDRMLEPRPTPEALTSFPELASFDTRRTVFLCMRAHKPSLKEH